MIENPGEIFEEFIREKYIKELTKAINSGEKALIIDFSLLDQFSDELADELLEKPEEILPEFESALNDIELVDRKLKVRFRNLPINSEINIRDLRSNHLGKLISITGIIRQTSDVRPVAKFLIYECPYCGHQIRVKQDGGRAKAPAVCPMCGKRGKFKIVDKVLVDTQRIVVEEAPDLTGNAQPRRISVFLTEDLVDPKMDRTTTPGRKVNIVGIPREIPIPTQGGGTSTRYDIIIDANWIEPIEQEFEEIEISKEDEQKIKEFAKDPAIYSKFIKSIAPSIFGYERIKEAIVLQLFGGVKTKRPDGTMVRGDIHLLLVGDPGVAKSQLLKYVSKVAPKARYVSGKGTSSAGLTAAVVKDEFLRGFSLEAGALVLANGGICCIDELDKMSKEDRSAMHEAMEQQTVTVAKANIYATLRAETSILAAANPRLGRFDPYRSIPEQIDLPPTLISRFDLIFVIKDKPDLKRDEKLAMHILRSIREPSDIQPEIDPEFMRKYIAYARQRSKPILSREAIEKIKNFFVTMRNPKGEVEEEGVRPIPISARQLEALVRLAQASAKVKLKEVADESDAERAINLVKYYLNQVGVDTETKQLDIDRILTGVTASQRNRIIVVREIIEELEATEGKNVPIEKVIEKAKEKGITEAKTEEVINKLKREGEVYEPKPGFVRRMPR